MGKSALDVSVMAAKVARSSHLAFRQTRWTLPKVMKGLHFRHVFLSRFLAVIQPFWKQSRGVKAFHFIFYPLVWLIWKMMMGMINDTHKVKKGGIWVPNYKITRDLRTAVALTPDEFFPLVHAGKILGHRAEITGFKDNTVLLSDGSSIRADIVVAACGFRSSYLPWLPEKYQPLVKPDGIALYRHLIHPDIPNVIFAGHNQSFIANAVANLGAKWAIEFVIKKSRALPSRDEMLAEADTHYRWKSQNLNVEADGAACVGTRNIHYGDALFRDLGLNPYRKKGNCFKQYFSPYHATDYFDEAIHGKAVPAPKGLIQPEI